MVVAQLAPETQLYWWITLAAGALVAVVLVLLLHILLRVVQDIEDGLLAAWEAGKQVARNTATTWMLGSAANNAEALRAELQAHLAVPDGEGKAR